MPKANVYNMAGQQVGEVELSEGVFGVEPNEPAVHAVVVNHLANCRQGTQSALTRAEVSGGGKKPWRQKGTGHARQGSTRAPQWTHGGIVFAPKPRDYSYRINQQAEESGSEVRSLRQGRQRRPAGGGRSGSGRHQDQEHPGLPGRCERRQDHLRDS